MSGTPPSAEDAGGNRDSVLLQQLLEISPDLIYFKDLDGRFLCASRSLARWFGLDDPSRLVGRTDWDFFTEEHARQAQVDEQSIIQSGQPIVGKIEKETWPDGRVTWVSSSKNPLKDAQGRIIGTFGISRDVTEQHLKDEQLALYAENLRKGHERMQEELTLASEVMNAMSMYRLETFPGPGATSRFQFHYRYASAEMLGGDFYMVTPFSEHEVLVLLCDVMGHGVSAALVAAIMRVWASQLSRRQMSPGLMLTELNTRLHALFNKESPMLFATVFCAVLDVHTGRMATANAGHPSPLVLDLEGPSPRVSPLSTRNGPGIGLYKGSRYAEQENMLPRPGCLLIFSDGLSEGLCRDDIEFPPERQLLMKIADRAETNLQVLLDTLFTEATNHASTPDDICIVAVEYPRPTA